MTRTPSIEEAGRHASPLITSPKITADHLQLDAAVYIRQSTSHQLRDHQESTARQYALQERLLALGWSDDHVVVIDEDLGISCTRKTERPGFRHLLNLITEERVGIVLGLEMSRLARTSKDWHDLFEVCAIYHTLIGDEDGIFDPQDPNDRLLLGLKGIISEMELHTMKVRLERGRLSKAQRGELFHQVPVGYVLNEAGLPQLDPDRSARHAMETFFELFGFVGSSDGLFRYLFTHNIKLPFRDCHGKLDWRCPARSTVYELLKHPLYAGAYGYGRTTNYKLTKGKQPGKKHLPPDQWKVFIKDCTPSYITWEQYETNQRTLGRNDTKSRKRPGPVRKGSALLSGILYCAHCGRRMTLSYHASNRASYWCCRYRTMNGVDPCFNAISSSILDTFVSHQILEALSPGAVDLSFQVIEEERVRRERLETLYTDRVAQARYAVELSERRYKAVDPANRLVAEALEQEWEAAMAELNVATKELESFRSTISVQLSEQEREQLRSACSDVSLIWHNNATITERKQITRLLLRKVEVEVHDNSDRVTVRLHWSGGFQSFHEITRTVVRFDQMESYPELLDRIMELTLAGTSASETAAIVESEGFHSPRSSKPISAQMIAKLLGEPRCRHQLDTPQLEPGHWRSEELARELGIREKRLKTWVTRGQATAIQRPHGRVWVIYADEEEMARLKQLAHGQSGQGSA